MVQNVVHCRKCHLIFLDGWNYDTSYRFKITHLPDTGHIKLKLFEGATLLYNIAFYDKGEDRLRGGRLGVYCDSQAMISWSALSYRYFIVCLVNLMHLFITGVCNKESFHYISKFSLTFYKVWYLIGTNKRCFTKIYKLQIPVFRLWSSIRTKTQSNPTLSIWSM